MSTVPGPSTASPVPGHSTGLVGSGDVASYDLPDPLPSYSATNKRPHLFATLTPISAAACLAFSDTVASCMADPTRYAHQKRFLDIGRTPIPLSQLLEERKAQPEDTDHSTRSSEKESSRHQDSKQVWPGNFCLSYDVPSYRPSEGWALGKVTTDPRTRFNDLMLGSEAPGLRSLHAFISFNQVSGYLRIHALHANSPVILNDRVVEKGSVPWALNQMQMTIRIGALAYAFRIEQYDGPMEEASLYAKYNYFSSVLRVIEVPIQQTFWTPVKDCMHIGDWVVAGTLGTGCAGITLAATRKNAPEELVAIKTVARRSDERRGIGRAKTEVSAFERVGPRVAKHAWKHYLVELKEVIQTPRNAERFWADWVCLVMAPLCRRDLSDVIFNVERPMPEHAKIAIFLQVLKGICCLHDCSILHRDIKPDNIGLCNTSPEPKIVLFDFGSSMVKEYGHLVPPGPPRVGTPVYMAPELENELYSYPVDVWSAGLVGYEIFYGKRAFPNANKNIWLKDHMANPVQEYTENRMKHGTLFMSLSQSETDSIPKLLSKMINWDPITRITISDAVNHPAFGAAGEHLSKKQRLG